MQPILKFTILSLSEVHTSPFLQSAINDLVRWHAENGVQFSIQKCVLMENGALDLDT